MHFQAPELRATDIYSVPFNSDVCLRNISKPHNRDLGRDAESVQD